MATTTLNIDGQYVQIPDVFAEVKKVSLGGNDFAVSGARLRKGVLFKSDTAGSFRVITLKEFNDKGGEGYLATAPPSNGQRNTILRSCTKETVFVDANEFYGAPIVFCDRSGAVSNNINVAYY